VQLWAVGVTACLTSNTDSSNPELDKASLAFQICPKAALVSFRSFEYTGIERRIAYDLHCYLRRIGLDTTKKLADQGVKRSFMPEITRLHRMLVDLAKDERVVSLAEEFAEGLLEFANKTEIDPVAVLSYIERVAHPLVENLKLASQSMLDSCPYDDGKATPARDLTMTFAF
jgi:hypothetical protein